MILWYQHPAKEWVQALPLGNGHLGAMAFGGEQGIFDLSENTCWSGEDEEDVLRQSAKATMGQVRALLLKGEITAAEELAKTCTGKKGNYGTQLPLGILRAGVSMTCEKQTRELDLMTGVSTDLLYSGDTVVKRESFLSNPAKMLCIGLSAEQGKLPPLALWLEGSAVARTDWQDGELVVTGKALENIHSDGLHGVNYRIHMKILTDGTMLHERKQITVVNATYCYAFLSAATDFVLKDLFRHTGNLLEQAVRKGWDLLKEEHVREHSGWMESCCFNMPEGAASGLPTDERLKSYRNDPTDYDLVTLFLQYGRYLLLNSSRPDSALPAALQGVWNDDRACRMEWTDDMHLDINTQMNYFPAQATGLSGCTKPLFDWIKNRLMPHGKRMARELYNADGWMAHTVSNAYGWAAPGWDYSWGFFVSGGAWAALAIWEHFCYNQDEVFLAEYYDILYESGRFLASVLFEDKDSGRLLTCPSYSPENAYFSPDDPKPHFLCTGSTADMLVAKCIFHAILSAAEILNREDDWVKALPKVLGKLPPFAVGSYGQLQEWYQDVAEAYPDHRHTCHLLSLYPFHLLDPLSQPELKKAAEISIKRRLGENAQDIVLANWAGALLVSYFAVLHDGKQAGDFLKPMMSFLSRDNMMITHEGPTTSVSGGIYELDGNTGLTAAVSEMLVQSGWDFIELLPAVPDEWSTGELSGFHCYGGHQVAIRWNNLSVEAEVTAGRTGIIALRYSSQSHKLEMEQGKSYKAKFNKFER